MLQSAVAFGAALGVSAAVTPLVRAAARRRGWFDQALSSRKVHGRAVPRLGGVAIVAGFFVAVLGAGATSAAVRALLGHGSEAWAILAGGVAIAALGLHDDLHGAGARAKFTVQFAAAALVYAAGLRIDAVAQPFGAPIELGALGLPLTMLWIAGVTNAVNLIDGLDGLAGGVALVAAGATLAVAYGQSPLALLLVAALAGAIVGFLFYNFNPATIFMGDTGSLFIGFILAVASIGTHREPSGGVALLVPVVALGLPICDTLLAIARRAHRGAPLFAADRGHLHHRLLDLGLSHRDAVLVMYGNATLLACASVSLSKARAFQSAAVLGALVLGTLVVLRRLGYLRVRSSFSGQAVELRRRNLRMRSSIRAIAERLRSAAEPSAVWSSVRAAAPALGARCVALELAAGGIRGGGLAFSEGFDEAPRDTLRARFSVLVERPGENVLELGWADGRDQVDRDTEIAIELLCEHVTTALERIGARAPSAANEPQARGDALPRAIDD